MKYFIEERNLYYFAKKYKIFELDKFYRVWWNQEKDGRKITIWVQCSSQIFKWQSSMWPPRFWKHTWRGWSKLVITFVIRSWLSLIACTPCLYESSPSDHWPSSGLKRKQVASIGSTRGIPEGLSSSDLGGQSMHGRRTEKLLQLPSPDHRRNQSALPVLKWTFAIPSICRMRHDSGYKRWRFFSSHSQTQRDGQTDRVLRVGNANGASEPSFLGKLIFSDEKPSANLVTWVTGSPVWNSTSVATWSNLFSLETRGRSVTKVITSFDYPLHVCFQNRGGHIE